MGLNVACATYDVSALRQTSTLRMELWVISFRGPKQPERLYKTYRAHGEFAGENETAGPLICVIRETFSAAGCLISVACNEADLNSSSHKKRKEILVKRR